MYFSLGLHIYIDLQIITSQVNSTPKEKKILYKFVSWHKATQPFGLHYIFGVKDWVRTFFTKLKELTLLL